MKQYTGGYAGAYLGAEGTATPAFADMAMVVTASPTVLLALEGQARPQNGPSGGPTWLEGYFPKRPPRVRTRNQREELVILNAA